VKQGDGNRLRPGPQANPTGDTGRCEPDILSGSAVAETIRASGHMRRAKQAGHMTACNLMPSPESPLPHRGRPHMSPKLQEFPKVEISILSPELLSPNSLTLVRCSPTVFFFG
jgi:hypothetical protein